MQLTSISPCLLEPLPIQPGLSKDGARPLGYHPDISQIRKWAHREVAGSHETLQPGNAAPALKPRACDSESKSIAPEGRAGGWGKKTPSIKWLGSLKKVRAPKLAALPNQLAGHRSGVLKGFLLAV